MAGPSTGYSTPPGPALSSATPAADSGAGASGSSALASRADHVHPAAGTTVNLAKATTSAAGTYTWTYPVAYGAGVVPNVQALAQAAAGTTDVLNVQLDGAPTNTQAVFRVTRTQQSVVALLGLTILSIPASIGAQVIHLRAEA